MPFGRKFSSVKQESNQSSWLHPHSKIEEAPVHLIFFVFSLPAIQEPHPGDDAGADFGEPEAAASPAATDGGSGDADGDDLKNGYKPPDHVTTGAVYSNAYRKSLASKKDPEGARADARKASRIFKIHGLVTPELCGKFSSQPRKKQIPKVVGVPPAEVQVESDVAVAEGATEP